MSLEAKSLRLSWGGRRKPPSLSAEARAQFVIVWNAKPCAPRKYPIKGAIGRLKDDRPSNGLWRRYAVKTLDRARTLKILKSRRDLLEQGAKLLLQKETLEDSDLREIDRKLKSSARAAA